ncbi:MAG: molybdenum cofactor carrier [Candidatus Competibacteraceae bacterium]|nr:molybdenum cofactor carrier [Candidatus Competibacteraceae bacterium]
MDPRVLGKIVSGGQTGVDRAVLDAALDLGMPCGGWCPKGRLAEDGVIPSRYPLTETHSSKYPFRTAYNVRDSDATLILTRGEPTGGTALTAHLAASYRKPLWVVDLQQGLAVKPVVEWITRRPAVQVLNVAGPRESQCPGIYSQAYTYLQALLQQFIPPPD